MRTDPNRVRKKQINKVIEFINKKITGFVTPVIIFCMVLFAGCSSSHVETVDKQTLLDDHDEILQVFSFKLKSGKIYNDSNHTIDLDFGDSSKPVIIYRGPSSEGDSTHTNKLTSILQSFSIFDVLKAKVRFQDRSLWPFIGGIAAAGIIVYLFWANGERNKRKSD